MPPAAPYIFLHFGPRALDTLFYFRPQQDPRTEHSLQTRFVLLSYTKPHYQGEFGALPGEFHPAQPIEAEKHNADQEMKEREREGLREAVCWIKIKERPCPGPLRRAG